MAIKVRILISDINCAVRGTYPNSYVKCSPTYKNDLEFIRERLNNRQIVIIDPVNTAQTK